VSTDGHHAPDGRIDVVGIGECLIAFRPLTAGPLFAASSFEADVVGAEANVCIGLARLDHHAALIGRVGADGLGESVLRQLRMEGVDVRATTIDPEAATGIQVREWRGFGPSEFIYYRRGSAGSRLCADDVRRNEELIAGARWLHLSGITPALSPEARDAVQLAADTAAASGTSISFDINVRTKLWPDVGEAKEALLELARRSDLVFAGDTEAALIVGNGSVEGLGERLLAVVRPGGTVIVKLEKEGAVAFADGTTYSSPGLPVKNVVDSVGAGDAFAAGYLSAVLDGLDQAAALARANACGAFAISASGDTRGLPRRYEVERLGSRMDEIVR
jgi:2-dehydro-3-deoxygluconokinase